ncbi:MAG: MarR family transcriptional regulator [Alphaproteobacteria bacterium]|nr:MarR family transcriptional regulator [Alphaproteobacteria bacterium]MDE2011547.1 MarR family transcriptional regulator [Alphaproteobacteria bacterium]MDE2074476.1 MarR family transcriptional regulator [Alphaproteobacteria bacterium]MDE2351261.1 MarR family transcriptional regulator [Alphaproteobacteria bacterium]
MSAAAKAKRRSPSAKTGKERARTLLETTGLSRYVGFVLRFAHSAVWSDLVKALQPYDVRPVHYSMLLILNAAPGARQQEIGEALSIQRPNLVALIDEMEERGIVRRQPHPADRRSHALYLTNEGAALLTKLKQVHQAHERRLNALFTTEERQSLIEELTRLARLAPDISV